MEQQVIGLIEEELRFVKKDDELASIIIKNREWQNDEEKIKYVYSCLRYNMFTISQFSDLTGISQVTLNGHYMNYYSLSADKTKRVSRLDICYPFRSLDSSGPKFVFRNEKSVKLLKKG